MKKLLLIVLAMLTVCISAACETKDETRIDVMIVEKDGKWGCVNENGDYVIEPQFDTIWD